MRGFISKQIKREAEQRGKGCYSKKDIRSEVGGTQVLQLRPGNWRRVGGRAGEKTEGYGGPQTRRLLSLLGL